MERDDETTAVEEEEEEEERREAKGKVGRRGQRNSFHLAAN